jgi:hypothetical protein
MSENDDKGIKENEQNTSEDLIPLPESGLSEQSEPSQYIEQNDENPIANVHHPTDEYNEVEKNLADMIDKLKSISDNVIWMISSALEQVHKWKRQKTSREQESNALENEDTDPIRVSAKLYENPVSLLARYLLALHPNIQLLCSISECLPGDRVIKPPPEEIGDADHILFNSSPLFERTSENVDVIARQLSLMYRITLMCNNMIIALIAICPERIPVAPSNFVFPTPMETPMSLLERCVRKLNENVSSLLKSYLDIITSNGTQTQQKTTTTSVKHETFTPASGLSRENGIVPKIIPQGHTEYREGKFTSGTAAVGFSEARNGSEKTCIIS